MLSKNFKKSMAHILVGTFMVGLISGISINVRADVNDKQIVDGVTVISKGNTNGHEANLIIDGDVNSYWESSNHYRWVEIDLGGIYDLSKIDIFNKQGASYKYNVYASEDGESYNKIAFKNDGTVAGIDGDEYDLTNVRAGKIRIDVTNNTASDNGNIAEVRIYGEDTGLKVPERQPIDIVNFDESDWGNEYKKFETDSQYAQEKMLSEIKALVGRVIGEEYIDNFIFATRVADDGKDVFEIEDTTDGKIKISGNNGIALASGFNHYLKNFCNVSYNFEMGSNLNMPEIMPKVEEKIIIDTPYDYRYALNFCTYSYTMSFWNWDKYEQFLDWCAMNGINLVLDIIGQEEVLRRTLNEFGYTDEEVKEFISGPAYFAWFYMQNMTSFGGPLTDNWFEERAELGRKMHDRMQTFGIKPVIQGYSGMVPLDFKTKNPDAQIISQGGWCGFDRPNMLRTYVEDGQRDYFQEVADVFYEKQKDLYGDITDYYAVDPFHEGGNTGGLNDGKIYGTIQSKMIEHDEDAIWVIQHWQGNPSTSKINGLANKDQALILDLNSELNPGHNRFDNAEVPWVWNMLHNFGGRMGMDAQPETVATEIPKALANSKHMKGIGMTPEALNTNPMVYELLFDMTWTRDQVDYRQWTYDYIERRYGKSSEKLIEAWDIILETAYKKRTDYYQGAAESVINARPSLSISSSSTWGNGKIPYDKKEFEKAISLFTEVYDEFKDSDAFLYDFADILKQLIANAAQEYHLVMVDAYNAKDVEKFKFVSNKFLEMIKLQDRVLSTREEFLVGNWINDARKMLDGADDWTRDLFEFNARALVTTWGARNNADNGGLKDYSNRQWAGLTGDYYYNRWSTWIDGLRNELEGGAKVPKIDWFKMEYDWVNDKSDTGIEYTTEASGESLGELAKIAMNGYSVSNMDEILGAGEIESKTNVAIGKPVVSETSGSAQGEPLSNLTDNNTGTMWISDKNEYPANVIVDLEGTKNVDGIEFAFRNIAGDRAVAYKVEVLNGDGQWVTAVDKSNDYENKGVIEKIDYKGTAQKVKVTLVDVNLEISPSYITPELAEVMVYESKEEVKEYINVAKGKPVTGSASESGKPLSNITDGNVGTLWISNGGATPANATIDLEGTHDVEKVELHFEKTGLRFKFKVDVENADGVRTTILDKTKDDKNDLKVYEIPVDASVSKIHVSITGKGVGGEAPAAWAAIAEVKALALPNNANQQVSVAVPQSSITATATSEHPNVGTEGLASFAIDNNDGTIWHTKYSPKDELPQSITLDIGDSYEVNKFTYLPRRGGGNGTITKYELQVSKDGETFTTVSEGSWDNNTNLKTVTFKSTEATHVRLVALEGHGGFAAAAELNVFTIPENIAVNESTTVSATSNNDEVNNVKDGDSSTLWQPVASEEKSLKFDLGVSKDISAVEILKSSNEALKYNIEYSQDGETWKSAVDNNENSSNYDNYFEIFKTPVVARYIRISFDNQDVKINEIKIYKANSTEALGNYIKVVEGIYNSAVVGDKSGNYTKESKDALGVAINKANEILSADPNSIEVDKAINELKKAVSEFRRGFVQVNRNSLAVLIRDVELLLEEILPEIKSDLSVEEKAVVEDYTKLLLNEKNSAKVVYKKPGIGQNDINKAYTSLKTTLDGYYEAVEVETAFKTLKSLAIKKAEDAVIGTGNGEYSKSVVDAFKSEIEVINSEFEASKTVSEINIIILKLQEAMDTFDKNANTGEDEEIVVSKISNLKSSNITNNSLTLNWDSPSKTVGLVEYVIYKDGKELATLPASVTEYLVTNLKVSTIYGFKVCAKYSNGKESRPVSINVRTKK